MVYLEHCILVQFSLENINFYYSEFTIIQLINDLKILLHMNFNFYLKLPIVFLEQPATVSI